MKIKLLKKTEWAGHEFEFAPGYTFTLDHACRDYDWLVVYDEMPCEEKLCCPWQHTILATQEPVSVKSYSQAYVRQFAHYLTNRPFEAERHPGWFFGQGYYLWYNGHSLEELKTLDFSKKDKLLSAVCSSKQMRHTKHHARLQLMRRLSERLEGFDWYGRGVRPIGKKYEALDSYRYHVAIENHIGAGHWSEKVADALLSECLPFYAGDPELGKVLPPDSFIPIPIDDPERAVEIIEKSVADGEYEKRRASVLEAKRLLFEKYNLHAQIIRLIETAEETDGRPRTRLFPRKALRWRSPSAALEDGWHHFLQYLEMV